MITIGSRRFLLSTLWLLLITACPAVTMRAAALPDDVVVQSGAAFTQGLRVNIVTPGDVQLGTNTAIKPLAPRYGRFGLYTSTAVQAAHPFRVLTLAVTALIPAHGLLMAAVRTALPHGPWSPWHDMNVTVPAIIQGTTATRWQYRLSLSADTLSDSPRVQQVTIRTIPLPPGYPTSQPPLIVGPSYEVFATREGLVGGTTANGHRIRAHDHFVALPSDTVLACDGCQDYTVTVS